jgi:predicted DNA-binding transcriptional regulator YafY
LPGRFSTRAARRCGIPEATLIFEDELAAAARLAGFGGQVEVLSPAAVRTRLIATARELLGRYAPNFPSVMTTSAPEMPELSPRN